MREYGWCKTEQGANLFTLAVVIAFLLVLIFIMVRMWKNVCWQTEFQKRDPKGYKKWLNDTFGPTLPHWRGNGAGWEYPEDDDDKE